MTTTHWEPEVEIQEGSLSSVDAQLLVVPVFEDGGREAAERLDSAVGGEVSASFERGEFKGELFQRFVTTVADTSWQPRRVALIGAGPQVSYSTDRARKLASAAALASRDLRTSRLAFALTGSIDGSEEAQAVAEGVVLAGFRADRYKSEVADLKRLDRLTIVVARNSTGRAALQTAAERGRTLASCSNIARGMGNEPGNLLPPRLLAQQAVEVAGEVGVATEVLGESEIEELRMGLLLGVARGSDEPPRLIVLRHEPAGAPNRPVLGLIGKGVTFDTGGISIKPAEGMEKMKDDMAGGAAVISAMRAISLLGAPIKVIGVIPAVENMPSGRAIRPGDVLRSASGSTVEVINTDAEGRLILADALWYARRRGATHLVDIATLTGSCVVALGKITTGLFGAPQEWVELVRRNAERAGDRCWPLPVFDEYRDQLRSEIADLMNSGGRPAGAITAAVFLKQFAGGLPWAHLDIAGTAWTDEATPYMPKGPTGVGVRTLAGLALTAENWNNTAG
jgi:leucyl aminopeptidase